MFTTDLLSASLSFVKYFGGNTEQRSDLPYLGNNESLEKTISMKPFAVNNSD